MSEQLKALGERIRETRKERGLTQLELAEKVRISPTYMSEIELGQHRAEQRRAIWPKK